MADEFDYTKSWNGVFTPPRPDDDRGIYLLDDEKSVGRNTQIYDNCTRVLYEDAHPRTHSGGQRYPGPYGGGRASDRVGPAPEERRAAEYFSAAPDESLYVQGSRRLGSPGFRSMVTSGREGRPAVDDVGWDERPPHYANDTPNKYAHLYVDPATRGPALYKKDATYPGFDQVDGFKNPETKKYIHSPAILQIIIWLLLTVLVAMWIALAGIEKRIGHKINRAVRKALAESGKSMP